MPEPTHTGGVLSYTLDGITYCTRRLEPASKREIGDLPAWPAGTEQVTFAFGTVGRGVEVDATHALIMPPGANSR